MVHESPNGGGPSPQQVTRFQQLYAAALEAVPENAEEPSHDDLTRLREALLDKPVDESPAISEARQAILDNPEQLRSFFGVFCRHDTAMRRLWTDGSLTLL